MTTAASPSSAVDALRSAVDGVLGAEWWRTGDPGVRAAVVEVERQVARLEAARLRLLAEADARGVGAATGASSTAAWFVAETVSRSEQAGSRVKRALALAGPLALTGAALAAGAMTADHAEVIHRAMARLPRSLDAVERERAEAFLVEQAGVLEPRDLASVAAVLRARLADGAGQQLAAEEDAALDQAEVTLVQDDSGRWHLAGTLPAEAGATLAAALEPLSAPAPAVAGAPDRRPARRRRAEALVHLADAWLADQSGTESSRPRLTVTVPLTTASEPTTAGAAPGLLPGGHPLSPTALAVLCCDAEVVPVLVDAEGVPLDVGRTVYAFPDRIRRAIALRDGGCTFRGCGRPASWCQTHHLRSYASGGATSERNGTLLCGFHHRLVHRFGWRGELRGSQAVRHPPDGSEPWVPPPPWAPAMDRLVERWHQRWSVERRRLPDAG